VAKRGGRKRQGPDDSKLSRGASWATIIGLPVAIVALLLGYLALGSSGSSGPKAALNAQLEPVDLIARNGLAPARPALELMVHNSGRAAALLSRVWIEVISVKELPLCFTQGDFPTSERYGVQLPTEADPGTTVVSPIHQEVRAGENDRFRLDVGVSPPNGEDAEPLAGLYLYEIAVSVLHDGEPEALDMGTALLSVPALPSPTLYFLTEGEFAELEESYNGADFYSSQEMWSEVLPCWQSNGRFLAAAASDSESSRPPQLQQLLASALVPSFAEVSN
jgi:hypothetical protein